MDGGCSIQVGVTRRARGHQAGQGFVLSGQFDVLLSLREFSRSRWMTAKQTQQGLKLWPRGEGVAKKASLPRLAGASGDELLRLGG